MIRLPVTNDPSQSFEIILENQSWIFRIDYNSRQDCWYMGLDKNGVTVCDGIKMVNGVALNRAFNFMEGSLIVNGPEPNKKDPVMGDWGVDFEFLYLDQADIDEINRLKEEFEELGDG